MNDSRKERYTILAQTFGDMARAQTKSVEKHVVGSLYTRLESDPDSAGRYAQLAGHYGNLLLDDYEPGVPFLSEDDILSKAQHILRDGYNDTLSRAIAQARDIRNGKIRRGSEKPQAPADQPGRQVAATCPATKN